MGEIKEIYLSKDFDKEKSLLYELSMLFSKDSCFYMLTRDKSVLLIKEFILSEAIDSSSEVLELLIDMISNDPLLKLDYYKTHIGIDTFKTILQPAELVIEGKEDILIKSVTKIYPVDEIVREDWDPENLVQITGIPQYLLNYLRNSFPETEPFHLYRSLHNYIVTHAENGPNSVIINLHKNYVNFFLYRNNKLVLINQFECQTEVDVLYYVRRFQEQFIQKEGRTHIYICGKANFPTASLVSEMSSHFERISYLNITRINTDLVLNDYLDLYSLSQ